MMIGTSHISNKYIDVNEHCDGDDIDSTTDIAFNIKEAIKKQKVNAILDNVSIKRVNCTKFQYYRRKLDME